MKVARADTGTCETISDLDSESCGRYQVGTPVKHGVSWCTTCGCMVVIESYFRHTHARTQRLGGFLHLRTRSLWIFGEFELDARFNQTAGARILALTGAELVALSFKKHQASCFLREPAELFSPCQQSPHSLFGIVRS